MKLSDYFKKMPRGTRLALAEKIGCHPVYLAHISAGRRIPSAKMAVDIETATDGAVSRYDLRDDALEIWDSTQRSI